jgi:tetratricopeptide (TPR) repeat protein
MFHESADDRRSHLVTVTGIAGIGKSRLAWEFFKYLDGLAEEVWWHRGRCLAYGEGVAYWALAEMVRTRAGIMEGEEQRAARAKLDACLVEHLPDEEERAWVAPRLANLLGLEERVHEDRQDLFAAWRLFFERLADQGPVVLLFEDLQWADAALLAFVEYLLEWSAGQRLYVLALARPELAAQSPDFARGVRNAAQLALEPLSEATMAELLDAYVPGLPAPLRAQVLDRAQGVPLYAVETVRMLLDRGLLVEEGSSYRPTGEITTLEVPETLHALVAARLDGLAPEERRLVQDACVLGKTFGKPALAALSGLDEAELEPLLASLVRKEVLSVHADPRQPERGQYGFLQELLREVAYEMLTRRDRKTRHLAAVAALQRSFEGVEQEAPEVLATHLLAAHRLAPEDDDAAELKRRAADALVRAAERAAALAAPEEAQRYYDQAAALADDASIRAQLLVRAGWLAFQAGVPPAARERLEQAIALYEQLGDTEGAARAGVGLADVDVGEGRLEQATQRLEAAVAALEQAGPSEELAATLAELGRMFILRGQTGPAAAMLERALVLAERLVLDEVLAQALTSRALFLTFEGRYLEGRLLLEGALAYAREHKLHEAWWRATNNLIVFLYDADRYPEALALSEEIATHARQRGDREQLAVGRLIAISALGALGRWQDAVARLDEADQLRASARARSELTEAVPVLVERGELARAQALLHAHGDDRDSEQADTAAAFAGIEAQLLRAQGRPHEALAAARRGLALRGDLGITNFYVKRCVVEALEAALALDERDTARELLTSVAGLHPGERTPSLEGHATRLRARLDAREGRTEQVEAQLAGAEAVFREHGLVFSLAVTQLEHAEWLVESGRAGEAAALLAEATDVFVQLGAQPWVERANAALDRAPAGVVGLNR